MYRVLVVDDDETILIFLSRLLKNRFDAEVFRAENGLEAISILEDQPIEAIFLDITMPIMDGLEMLKIIRDDNRFKTVPVVIMSAVAEKEIIDAVMELGVFSYMLKPMMYETAAKIIQQVFDTLEEEQQHHNLFNKLLEREEKKKKKILIVDQDEIFKEKLKMKLDERFIIYDTNSGAKGLNIFIKEKPEYVFLSENLPLLTEDFLAVKMRDIFPADKNSTGSDEKENAEKVHIYLMKPSPETVDEKEELKKVSEDEKKLFDEVFIKSSEEDKLLIGMQKALKF
ncbi:MAG: response regulator [Chlorobi bacterium]|nr:response regulator [Chlorobiota bacterium]